MAAYVIADVGITDPAINEQYRSQVLPTVQKYGGRFIVRGGATEKVEGDWQPQRVVVIEFESMDKARQWYHSPEYSSPIKLRHQSARTNLIFVEGV